MSPCKGLSRRYDHKYIEEIDKELSQPHGVLQTGSLVRTHIRSSLSILASHGDTLCFCRAAGERLGHIDDSFTSLAAYTCEGVLTVLVLQLLLKSTAWGPAVLGTRNSSYALM